jgi:hypothetical protein
MEMHIMQRLADDTAHKGSDLAALQGNDGIDTDAEILASAPTSTPSPGLMAREPASS